MTTTSTFQGMNEEAKPSSRVLKPPGGGSSNIFGGPEPAPAPKPRASGGSGNIFGGDNAAPAAKPQASASKPPDAGIFNASGSDGGKGSAQRSARDGSYNPITGSDYKDLAPNHHALNVRELPKPQKEQPPLPCSDGEYQAKEGKMQNVQTSTRVTNPPGGKTHKLW